MKKWTVEELVKKVRNDPRLRGIDIGRPPCNGCRLCCTGQSEYGIPLQRRFDDPSLYKGVKFNMATGQFHLPTNPATGNCAYLGEDGCTIHEDAPAICRSFDCRVGYVMRNDPPKCETPEEHPIMQKGKALMEKK